MRELSTKDCNDVAGGLYIDIGIGMPPSCMDPTIFVGILVFTFIAGAYAHSVIAGKPIPAPVPPNLKTPHHINVGT